VIVTVFRGYTRKDLNPQLLQQVEQRGVRMYELASNMPGFISYKEFQAADGESVAIVEFATLEQVRAWHDQPEHREELSDAGAIGEEEGATAIRHDRSDPASQRRAT